MYFLGHGNCWSDLDDCNDTMFYIYILALLKYVYLHLRVFRMCPSGCLPKYLAKSTLLCMPTVESRVVLHIHVVSWKYVVCRGLFFSKSRFCLVLCTQVVNSKLFSWFIEKKKQQQKTKNQKRKKKKNKKQKKKTTKKQQQNKQRTKH